MKCSGRNFKSREKVSSRDLKEVRSIQIKGVIIIMPPKVSSMVI